MCIDPVQYTVINNDNVIGQILEAKQKLARSLPFSLWTKETKIGGKSPSSSNNPFAKAAAVFMTRPSSLVLIFKSCRNVECSRNIPPPGLSGYNS